MGCSGTYVSNENERSHTLLNKWGYIQLDIKDSITSFLFKNHFYDVKVGIFEEKEYKKGKKWKVVNKNVKRKVFILYEQQYSNSELNRINEFLNNFFNKNPIYQLYNNTKSDEIFSPMKIMNDNFNEILPSKYINQDSNKLFIFSFSNSLNNETEKLKKFKDDYPDNYDFKIIKNSNDKFSYLNGYTLFFHKNKLLYWIKNEYLPKTHFNSLIEEKKKTTIEEYDKFIKNFISNTNTEDKEFYVNYTKIILYNSSGLIILNKIFPVIIQSLNELLPEENENNLNLIKLVTEKQNIYDKIKDVYEKIDNSIKIIDIETFKEKKYSLISQSLFTYQKKMIIKLSPISFKILKKIIDSTKKELNPFLKKLNPQYSINHIVMLPSKNDNFAILNNTKKVIVLFRFSKCLDYIYGFLKKKYSFFTEITFICLYNKSIHKIENNLKEKIIFLAENDLNDDINCYFENLYSYSYNSHLLIILDNNSKISFCDFFKNSASIYYEHLKNKKENISSPLENIEKSIFKKEIKNEFIQNCENYWKSFSKEFSKKKVINTSNIFKEFYNENFFYQPYFSLKYNITLKKNIKNYTINMIDFNEENINNNIPLKNELCKSFSKKESFCNINEYIRCKICNDILFGQITNQGIIPNSLYSFYICPITNNIYCLNCYVSNSNQKEIISYPFNLLYVKCNDKRLFMNIPYNNIYYFRNSEDIQNYPEVKDNICDICIQNIYSDNSKYFYLLVNFLNRNNPFLVCEKCFAILNDSQQNWRDLKEYEFLIDTLKNNFIDINNLLFKKIKIK